MRGRVRLLALLVAAVGSACTGCGGDDDYSASTDCSTCQGYDHCLALCAGGGSPAPGTPDAGRYVPPYDAGIPTGRMEAGAEAGPLPDSGAPGDASVPACAADAGAPTTIAGGQRTPGILAINSTQIVWVDFLPAPAAVMSASLDGGTPVVLASLPTGSPRGIAADDAYVYWTDVAAGAVMRVSLAGGTPATLASGQDEPIGVRVNATHVYWTTAAGGTVMRAPLDGGAGVTLAQNQGEPGPIALDAKNAYWTNLTGEVMAVPLSGGVPSVLAFGQTPVDVAVDSTSVYWANEGAALVDGVLEFPEGSVAEAPLDGGPVSLLALYVPHPERIAVDATAVYVTAVGGDNSVQRVSLDGSTHVVLAAPGCGGDDPFGLAVNASSIFWSNSSTGTVLSLPRP